MATAVCKWILLEASMPKDVDMADAKGLNF
jgi:hypothetical protein